MSATGSRYQYHQVLASSELGGGNLAALGLVRFLREQGEATPVWVPGDGAAAECVRQSGDKPLLFDPAPMAAGGWLRNLVASCRLAWRFRRRRPGLVHVHAPLLYGTLSRALRRAGMPRVVHVQLEESEEGLRWALQRPPELIVTCARFLVAHVRRCLPEAVRESQRIEAVPNAVDLDRFSPGDKPAAKRKVGAPPDRPLLLMLANLAPHKGQETAIRAVAELKRRGLDVECWLAGIERGGGRAYTDHLRGLSCDLEVGGRVRLLGFRQDAPELLRAADLFLLPSTNEGLPLTVLEAQATKVPVLASATAGIPEVVRDGETGFLIPPSQPEAYADAVERLLREPDLRQRVTEAAHDFVSREHSWQAFGTRIRSLYEELRGRAGSRQRPEESRQTAGPMAEAL